MEMVDDVSDAEASHLAKPLWSYEEAFLRNLGLISRREQEVLRNSCVAIPGMGGVGGIHLMTLARLGIGAFRIADPDTFQVANFNRQYGAEIGTLDANKAEVMAEKALAINPDAKITVFPEPVTPQNVGSFLEGVDVVVDGIDYFAFDVRRQLFRAAQAAGLWTVTAGPIGFGSAWLTFDPHGMSFDEYFGFHDGMDPLDQFVAFTIGLSPSGIHWPYFDISQIDRASARGPAVSAACHLASGVAGVEVIKILLDRKPLSPAPNYAQFDAYRRLLRTGKIRWGSRHPMQRLKRYLFRKRMMKMGFGATR